MADQQIQIKALDEDLKGRYSNLAQIGHTKEEFWIDFFNVLPPTGVMASRIIMSPGHLKRLLRALGDNLKNYEAQFGNVAEAEAPKNEIGFKM